jgi:NAD(P)H-hydrate epimerase
MKGVLKQLKVPERHSRKGENGKLLIVAGSNDYHGAPAFCALGARRFCDLVYFMCAEESACALSQIRQIRETIVVDELPEADAVLYGPGISEAKFPFSHIKGYKKKVIDGDGLKRVSKKDLEGTIITPHEGEFRRLFGVSSTPTNVQEFAEECNCTILKKGPTDYISDGEKLLKNKNGNAGMTKGGTGDVLSGLTAALFCTNSPLVAAASAAYITTLAGDILFKECSYAYCASDLAEALPKAYKKALK